MSGVNKCIIVGRLGVDPETKELGEGKNVTNFSIATSESWNDKSGQKQEKTEWHKIVTFNKLADVCGKYLSKGKQVYVEGKLRTRSWEDNEGNTKYMTEIVANSVQFLGSKEESAQAGGSLPNYAPDSF